MKQKLFAILLVILASLCCMYQQAQAQNPPGIKELTIKNVTDSHIKFGWAQMPGAKSYRIALSTSTQTWKYSTVNNWTKVSQTLLKNNKDEPVMLAIIVVYDDNYVSLPYFSPLVEVEIIYDVCNKGTILQNTDNLVLVTDGKPVGSIGGDCLCDYSEYTTVYFNNFLTLPAHHVPTDCDIACHSEYLQDSYPERRYFTDILLDHGMIYPDSYAGEYCNDSAKTAEQYEQPEQAVFVTFSPNPFTNECSVSSPFMDDSRALLQIYNSSGKLILERELTGTYESTINTDSFTPGVYLANVIRNGQVQQQTKLLKF